ncbi:MAG TPA: AsmA-like C-terminal region-containing protein, partial [Burkholderiaceae bacterium]|nr:AsmA-like C-terminal region-containing protein [Burkholderiaceae bacterium]
EVRLGVDQLAGTQERFRIGKLELSAQLQQAARKIAAALAGAASGSIAEQTLGWQQVVGDVTIDDGALPQNQLKLPVVAGLMVDGKKKTVDLNLTSKFDETQMNAKVDVAGFEQPAIRFDVRADRFNVDRYFPPQKGGGKSEAPAKKEGASDEKIDLAALRNLNLSGEARIGHLQLRGIKADNLRVVAKAGKGRLDLAPIGAQLYEGAFAGSASAVAGDNRLGLDAQLVNVSINPLLKDAAEQDLLEGRGNVKLAVTTSGATAAAMKRALDGAATIVVRDGALRGINIAQKLRDAGALLSGGVASARAGGPEKTDFSELSVNFKIDNGIATSDDLSMKSPLLRLAGNGQVNLVENTLDYTARISVVGTLKGQDGRTLDELRGVTVPLKLAGPFDALEYTLDWSGLAKDALKSKAAEQIKREVEPEIKEQREKLEERARDALKGLLKR